ncbi:HEAT repeat domain-containing protein [Actinomadura geliboluensis]|uniref:HEAT repeat domain-containing protein n=1 Tax=Actinomadura geliboluensis TaxID=882440 RepID=UPI0036A43CB0
MHLAGYDPDQSLRRHADAELGAYDTVRATVPLLRALLGNPDPHICAASAYTLGCFPSPRPSRRALEGLLRLSRHDTMSAVFARCSLGGFETGRHGTGCSGTEMELDADRLTQVNSESTALIRELRTFNPQVVRQRSSAQWSMPTPWLMEDHVAHATMLARNGSASLALRSVGKEPAWSARGVGRVLCGRI